VERFYIALNRFDAYLVLHRLQQAGIVAHVFNENMQSIVGDVPPDVAQPQVWLEDSADRPRAEKVLAAMRAERARTGNVWCRNCGEENPANFELCWKCGRSL
jgi:Putative prokaryotic signal transducing protein